MFIHIMPSLWFNDFARWDLYLNLPLHSRAQLLMPLAVNHQIQG